MPGAKTWLAAASLVLLSGATASHAQTDLQVIRFSGDIANRLPGDGGIAIAHDHSVSAYDFDQGFANGFSPLGNLVSADLDAYHVGGDGCGGTVYSVDSTIEYAGNTVGPADVFDNLGTILDASAEGIPAGVNIDALSRDPDTCQLVFSIDVTAEIDGQPYGPGDLVAWDSTSGFSLYAIDEFGIDIDALHLLGNERMLVSVSSAVQFPDVFVHDDEVFEVMPDSPEPSRVLSFSARTLDDTWVAADLDALWAEPRVLEELIFADRFESP